MAIGLLIRAIVSTTIEAPISESRLLHWTLMTPTLRTTITVISIGGKDPHDMRIVNGTKTAPAVNLTVITITISFEQWTERPGNSGVSWGDSLLIMF